VKVNVTTKATPKTALFAASPSAGFSVSPSLDTAAPIVPSCVRPTPTRIFVSQSEMSSRFVFERTPAVEECSLSLDDADSSEPDG